MAAVTAWRLYKPKHAATAFTGQGARRFGGRLNSKGVAVVYTSATLSLAAMELLVHLQSADVLASYAMRSVRFDEGLVTTLTVADLPRDWNHSPPPPGVQRVGDEWVRSGASAVLRVPSVIVPTENNYLLNPNHPDFAAIQLGVAEPFQFDPRLLKA
jgi:RES domain-containing protein